MDLAELGNFVQGGAVDFFLGVEAGPHGPFVEKMEQGAGLDQADGFGVGENVECDFRRGTTVEQFVFGAPGFLHGAVVEVAGAGIIFQEHGRDVVRLTGVGESEKRTRARDHAVTLVLAVGGVTDFFCERVIGVLEGAHGGSVDAHVERFETIEIAGGIEQAVDGFGVAALRFGLAKDGAVGFGHYARGVG